MVRYFDLSGWATIPDLRLEPPTWAADAHIDGVPVPTAAFGERGATLVEGALVAPLFFLLIFSILEFGLVFRQYLTMSTADRNGTHAASTAGNAAQADYVTLQAIKKSSTTIKTSEIAAIVIFKASGPAASINDVTLQACLTASVAGVCNRYTATDLARPVGDFGNCSLGSASPDRFWCPTTRVVAASGPPDYIGVYITTRYQAAVTKVFGKSYNLSEQTPCTAWKRRHTMMRRRRRSERGTNFVEMALVVPLLLTLMLGIFEVGMMFSQRHHDGQATRTTARTGSTAGKAPTATSRSSARSAQHSAA